MSKEIQSRQECCKIWNDLKDKAKMIDYLVESKQRIAELEEQLKNAIVPKFKIGQTSYYIFNGMVGIFKPEKVCEVRDMLILGIQFYGQEIQYQTTYGLFNEDALFATKEEAQVKLKELGENK
jgi:hypothetical protein